MRILQFGVGNLDSVFFYGKISPFYYKEIEEILENFVFLV